MTFLSHFPGYYLQTFDDKGIDKSLTRHGVPGTVPLVDLNSRGAGVFFTPNKFTKSRKAEDCEGVNAWFFEIDDLSIDEQWDKVSESPLMPSLVVKTKKSLHCYFLAEDGTKERFREVQKGLIQYFGSDKSCKDISRVLRVPGYYHNKGEPHMVELIWEEGNKYTEKQMLDKFPYREVKEAKVDFWDAVGALDNKQVLQRISGSRAGNFDSITFRKRDDKTEYIDVNGKPADAWIDEDGKIGSGSGGGPTFIQWLGWYGWSKGEIAKWVKESCADLLPREALEMQVEEVNVMDVDMGEYLDNKYDLTWGASVLDNSFSPLGRGKYVVLVGETGVGKTAFSFHFAKKNAELGHKVLYLSLEMSKEALLARYAVSKLGLSKTQWRNGDYDKDQFHRAIWGLPLNLSLVDSSMIQEEITTKVIADIAKKGGYDMIFIDNFGFITSVGETDNERVKRISRDMVKLKNEVKVTVVALHHFRKGGEKTAKIRNMDAMLGSGKIGHDVDFAIQVTRNMDLDEDADSISRAELTVFMMKDRDFGDVCFSKVYFNRGEFSSTYLA